MLNNKISRGKRCSGDFKGFNSLAMAEDTKRVDIVMISTIADPGVYKEEALGKILIIPFGPKAMNLRWILLCQKKLKTTLLCGVRWQSSRDSLVLGSLDCKLGPESKIIGVKMLF